MAADGVEAENGLPHRHLGAKLVVVALHPGERHREHVGRRPELLVRNFAAQVGMHSVTDEGEGPHGPPGNSVRGLVHDAPHGLIISQHVAFGCKPQSSPSTLSGSLARVFNTVTPQEYTYSRHFH